MPQSYLRRMAHVRATPVSLENLYRYGRSASSDKAQRLRNAQFLHKELQVRIAQRVVELERLPLGVASTAPVRGVVANYEDYFDRVAGSRMPGDADDEEDFADMLRFILQDNSEVIESTSRGVLEVRSQMHGFSVEDQLLLDGYLNRFYLARIGLRFLIEHHLESRDPRPGFAGIIQSKCTPVEHVEAAAEEARCLCERAYGVAPEVSITQIRRSRKRHRESSPRELPGPRLRSEGGRQRPISFTYVPGHLSYMLQETLKNAFRATAERWPSDALPPVRVTIVEGASDVTVRVSDVGGGMERAKLPLIWSYLHSTAQDPRQQAELVHGHYGHYGGGGGGGDGGGGGGGGGRASPVLAGYGVGLPLSRLYARYFGGDLKVESMEGHCTDATLYLSRLGHNCENLPEGVARSPAEADSTLRRGESQVFFFGDRRSWRENVAVGTAPDYHSDHTEGGPSEGDPTEGGPTEVPTRTDTEPRR